MDIQRYLDLVTSEHKGKPKFTAWLTAKLTQMDDITAVANTVNAAFDLDNAVGTQLDIIGQIVGRNRTLNFQPAGGGSPLMDDTTYRLVIKAKIAQNSWDGTIQGIYDIWNALFPSVEIVISDNQDMTVSILIIGLGSQMEKDLISHGLIIPKAVGVTYSYAYPTNPVFAYDYETNVYKGYDEGYYY